MCSSAPDLAYIHDKFSGDGGRGGSGKHGDGLEVAVGVVVTCFVYQGVCVGDHQVAIIPSLGVYTA